MSNNSAEEFKSFIQFLTEMWGILAGISVFFPLSSKFLDAIPIEPTPGPGGVELISPNLFILTATAGSLFIILFIFSSRSVIAENEKIPTVKFLIYSLLDFLEIGYWTPPEKKKASILRVAGESIVVSAVSISSYFYIYFKGIGPSQILSEIIALLAYIGFFTSMTAAFVLLAAKEYVSP